MELFEALLAQEQVSIERFVRFRIDSPADAEDILQETYLTAYQKFSQLRNPDAFKAWVISIARNKCTDYFRQKALRQETSFEALAESADSRYGASDSASVRETFDTLREKDRQILHFFFWEELAGWFLIPRLGEKCSWGMYDIPSRKCSNLYHLQVTGKARVHGIEGVELTAEEDPRFGKQDSIRRSFVAQLTDTHCRYLAVARTEEGVRNYITFLDGPEFMLNWGYGADNCGKQITMAQKGTIRREGAVVTTQNADFLLDIVGRYTLTIGGKAYETVCVMDIERPGCDVITEQFLDRSGRTILWRRFNRDDWALDRYGAPWTKQLPDNDRLLVNGTTYVHWYDCITDYIL